MILHEGYCYCPQDHTFDSHFKKCVRTESSALDEGMYHIKLDIFVPSEARK